VTILSSRRTIKELRPAELDYRDWPYEVLVTIRAVKTNPVGGVVP
jgi:hypothetical protein